MLSVGIVQAITDDIRLMGEAQWQNWSAFDKIDITILGGPPLQSDVQNYKDALLVAFGGEYDINDQFTVRAGAAWDQTPTTTGFPTGQFPPAINRGATSRTARVPDEDRIWVSIDGTYNLNDHMSIDAGYSYLFALDDALVGLRAAPAGSQVLFEGSAHILSVGGTLKF